MSKIDFTQNPLIYGLACACLDEQLRRVLLFEANATTFRTAAEVVSDMLTTVTGQTVTRFTLNSSTSEEDIWGHYTFQEQAKLDWQAGKLLTSDDKSDTHIKLVLIPDLSRLSLAATRAAVMLLGAEVAHLQRYGQDAERPISNLFWLAACQSHEVGMLSPHLLERFALRLSAQSSVNTKPVTDASIIQLSTHLQTAAKQWPEMPKAIITQVTDYFEEHQPRRELALARLAIAITRLENAHLVTPEHLKTAAQLIGLQLPEIIDKSEVDEPSAATPAAQPLPKNIQLPNTFPEATEEPTTEITVSTPTETESISEPMPLPEPPPPPYPEDTAPVQHADNPLKLPYYRHNTAKAHGPIIGAQRTRDLRDMAWVATILAAAKCQKIRGNDDFPHQPLKISRYDLHSHRRIRPPQQLLLLVLDYTCLQDCDWQESLIPHLRRAYVERASVCLIQVGAKTDGKAQELCALRITAPNILVPRISEALEAEPGRATPLAHGLDLALLTLRSTLQHGRNAAQQATLIVLTDGRGNVPLQASQTGRISPPVNRQGIEDAITVAQRIQGLQNLSILLLNPQPRLQSELPIGLANTLGAAVENIPINPIK